MCRMQLFVSDVVSDRPRVSSQHEVRTDSRERQGTSESSAFGQGRLKRFTNPFFVGRLFVTRVSRGRLF